MKTAQVRPAEAGLSPSPQPSNVPPTDQRTHAAPEVFWDVSASTYRAVWLALVALNVVVELYVFSLACGYFVLTYVPALSYYTSLFHLIPLSSFPIVVTLYGTVALLYLARICQFVYLSLRHRQLVFPASRPQSRKAKQPSIEDLNAAGEQRKSLSSALWYIRHHIFSTLGFCGVRGVYFESVMMLREVVEIAMQTYQAYVCSQQTTKIWVNATFAGLIVVNCYSSPLLHHMQHNASKLSETGAHRATVLAVDLALDLIWFTVIPILLWFPYMQALVSDELVIYRDTFVLEGILELPAMMVTSYVDLVMKLWPAVSLYYTMKKLELLVRRKPNRCDGARQHASRSALTKSSSQAIVGVSHGIWLRTRIERWLRLLLLLWGHTVLAVYIHANFVHSPVCSAGCQLVLRPWLQLSRACQCAALEVDCHALRIRGNASEIEDALVAANANVDGLMNLILAHCPALHVPPAVGRLRNLYGLALFNCSIASWHSDAWVTSARHPKLGRVQLVHTFVAEVPMAIAHADLPPRLLEIDIVASNLSRLPDDVAQHWSRINTLLLDHGRFREYPRVLGRMPALETVSLYSNAITHIPDDALANNSAMRFFHLALNPLAVLPRSLGLCTNLRRVFAIETRVSDVSSPFGSGSTTRLEYLQVLGFASPVCEDASSLARSTSLNTTATWLRCDDTRFVYGHAKSYAYYPLEAKLAEKQAQ